MSSITIDKLHEYRVFKYGKISVAYVIEDENIANILFINTDRDHRNKGFGSKILMFIIDYYKGIGFKEINSEILTQSLDKETELKLSIFLIKHGFIKKNELFKLDLSKSNV